jgi:uncharacterized surface protein with fasciclin (FAS1) repeats
MRRIFSGLLAGALMLGIVAGPVAAAGGKQTIAEIAAGTGVHTTLVAALECTGLLPVVSGKGQFTVFAPTDAAFGKLGRNAGNVCALPQADLTNILLYHVARGERLSGDVVESSKIRMLNRDFAPVSVSPAGVFVGGAELNLGLIDIRASNGVIHVTNDVLLP